MSEHIISPQNNSPIASVIQDAAVGSYMLTNTWMSGERETMISKDIFQDCLEKTNISLERYHDLLQRAHLVYHEGLVDLKKRLKTEKDDKKREEYKEDIKVYKEFCKYITYDEVNDTYGCVDEIPGKLMISILFPPVFCYWRRSDENDIYPIVKIKHGIIEPTSGPLNKKECKFILHYLWKEHSTQRATMFLTEVQRLVYNWQPHHGFSIGPSDCLPTPKAKEEIAKALSEVQAKVADILSKSGSEIDERTEAEINQALNSVMNIGARIAKTSMNKGDRNALNIMRKSGAKGSLVNLIQITAFVGQQNIGGKRMPRDLSNGLRSLPHFLPNDNSPEARGFISNSYIDGLTPEQAFNHARSGREGIISTAVKTADSGYIQKRIGRKVEDLVVKMDGSVRDASDNIIQFLYGDDGMDAKKLYSFNGLDFPFFVNVFSIANKVNSTAIRSEEVTSDDEPRHLRDEEIELLLTYIKIGPPGVNTPVLDQVTENFRSVLRLLLPKVKIYECKIGDYFAEIKHMLICSKVEYGDMVGLVAASSIGEPTTQLSTSRETRVIVRVQSNSKRHISDVKYGTIGDIIDKLLKDNVEEIVNIGKNSVLWKPTRNIYIMTVNRENEKTEWKKLSEVSRHPTNGNLVRVKTKSKREVTTTLTHSHLSRTKEGKIVPKIAKDLKKGDFIPVNKRMNSKILYKKIIIQGKKEIESAFPFDFDNGWLFGAYLAEGNINRETGLKITNISEHFERRTLFFTKRYGGKMNIRERKGKILEEYPEYPGREYTVSGIPHIVRFILKHCGTGSAKKNVPGFAYFAPLEFVSGLLRGYFDGDGNVNAERQLIRVHSISLNLLEQISLLLSRFGIFGTFGVEKKNQKNPLHYYIILRKYARLFLDNIGSDFPEKLFAIQEIVDYNEREDVHSRREDIDRIPEMGEEIARVAKPLGLPGYSRNYGRWTRGKTSIGRETLTQYREVFDTQAEVLDQKINLSLIDQAINSDVIWDEIVEIEIIDDPKELVYDFGVEGNHTFMIQNGIFVHNTLNFFHLAGVGGKDVSLGVPRLNELLNITKSDRQKKPSCTIYLNDPVLKNKAQKVCRLEEKNKSLEEGSASYVKNEERIQKAKEDSLMVIQDMKKMFEEATVDTYLKGYKMMYIPDDVCEGKGMNPIKIVTYEEYKESWWVSLSKDLGNIPDIIPQSWVVLLEFDTEKLFTTKISLDEIAIAIENEADNQMACVPSPDVIGQMEIYFNFQCIKKYIKDKKGLPSDKEGLNEDNIDFFVCRDSIMSYIKKTHISGISRISKVYPREDPSTHEWILDTAGSNFLQILNIPGVDITRTMSDDVWAVNEVLGIMAARKFLIEELTRVISFDGTYVNPRHIQLLVDRMTYTGDITSVRRDGISRESVGPIAKIMFEQQIGNGSMAALSTEVDLLKSVSSSVMYGTSCAIGTAAVDVKDPDKIPIKPPSVPSNKIRTRYPGSSKRSKVI
uniref:DNA-directed RNA polymerase n=1 Tax=Marseillevirus LCMAC101 TaxID=2506602 RepID=A0A481YSW0_9VIRU|nr:MAG: DNA-directed RNA polymerase subunit alpha [Marseillevirus LCMAC101]